MLRWCDVYAFKKSSLIYSKMNTYYKKTKLNHVEHDYSIPPRIVLLSQFFFSCLFSLFYLFFVLFLFSF